MDTQVEVITISEPHNEAIISLEKKHERLIRILEPIGIAISRFFKRTLHVDLDRLETLAHPKEDSLQISERFPIFIVADGITLELDPNGTYPNPSGATEVAKIFCAESMKEAEKYYNRFSEGDTVEVFRSGNSAVKKYNESQGRTKDQLNYWDIDLFGTTTAFAVLKSNKLYWASVCDSYMTHFDNNMNLKFRSPECWPNERRCFPPDWEQRPEKERKMEIRRTYRNGAKEDGTLCGYGAITGEQATEKYLNHGVIVVEPGDKIFLYTDGFEQYFDLPEFTDLFKQWPDNLEQQITKLSNAQARKDGSRYGHERTLIGIKIR